MALCNEDFKISQGATFTRSINYVGSSNTNAFASAISAEGMVRTSPESCNVVAIMNCTFSTVTTNNDTLTISLTSDQTQSFIPSLGRVLWYDVKTTFADNTEIFIIGGRLLVDFTVTRP